jgi:FkbM family methyltransferase
MHIIKRLLKPTSRALRNLFRMLDSITSQKKRFIRLNPFAKGIINFFDKKNKQFISLSSRGENDSSTLDEIFTKYGYRFDGMARTDDIYHEYNKIIAAGKEPLIIDCGANIGAATYFFSYEFPKAKVIGVELEHSNFELAQKNNVNNPNVKTIHAAIGPDKGFVDIANPNETNKDAFQTKLSSKNAIGAIKMISISNILEIYPDTIPFITKVDIEGFEGQLFSNNTQWMDRFYLIALEVHDWMLPKQGISKNFLSVHSKLNRDFYLRGDTVFSIKN